MALHIITAESPELSFAREGIGEYLKRISRFSKIFIHEVSLKKLDETILKKTARGVLVLLDESGKQFSSRKLSEKIAQLESTYADIYFVIGGPDGHSNNLRQHAHLKLSLSEMTFPHDLATLTLIEALYRSKTIEHNHPYHRD